MPSADCCQGQHSGRESHGGVIFRVPICHVPRIRISPSLCAGSILLSIYRRSARFRMQLPPISLSLSLSLSLSCATLAGGGKLVKTTYRRNCTVFPTIVFTNMVLG